MADEHDDYAINKEMGESFEREERAAEHRARYQASTQPPYSTIIAHSIVGMDDTTMFEPDPRLKCKCNEYWRASMFMYHVRDEVMDEMLGRIR